MPRPSLNGIDTRLVQGMFKYDNHLIILLGMSTCSMATASQPK